MTRDDLERELESMHAASFGWALTCCRWDRAEAEDVVQTAYVRAIEGRATFNGHSSTRTWFFGVVRNTAAERRRRRWVRGEALARWLAREPEPVAEPDPESSADDREARDRIRATLDRLSVRQREVLHLAFYQDLTLEQVAEVLHVPLGTVRTHYQRGKRRLRALLSESGS